MRYKITIEYDGTNYVGWARQKNGRSIQGCIEEAIYNYCQQKVVIYGAGRTDSGVHAYGQVAHFDIIKNHDKQKVLMAINFFLRFDNIVITDIVEVNDDFHARFSATQRHYVYKIFNRKVRSVLNEKYCWWIKKELNLTHMQQAANYLLGTHDFTSFCASEYCGNTVRTIDNINFVRYDDNVEMHVSAKSFLHHQVRNFIGTIVNVGIGKVSPDIIKIILAAQNRSAAFITAPSHGLYLLRINY